MDDIWEVFAQLDHPNATLISSNMHFLHVKILFFTTFSSLGHCDLVRIYWVIVNVIYIVL